MFRRPARRWIARGLVLLVVLSLLAPATVAALTGGSNEPGELSRGTVRSAAAGSTVVESLVGPRRVLAQAPPDGGGRRRAE